MFGKKFVFFPFTAVIAFLDKNFASANHCSVSKGSIIELDLSPNGITFLILSIFSIKFLSLRYFITSFLASNLSKPIYSLGQLLFNFPFFSRIFIEFKLCLFPISKSLKSWAGVTFKAPDPWSIET